MKKHIIWSNENLNLEDWRDGLIENMELNGLDTSNITDEELIDEMYEINDSFYDDARMNLYKKLDNSILVIADLGLWNGRRTGYEEIESGNIADCLDIVCGDYITWYVDERGDLCCDDSHHDGTNHYLCRVWKDTTTETQRENLLEKIYNGNVSRADITRLTRKLGTDIAAIYGFVA